MAYLWTNNAISTIAGSVGTGDTSLSVAAGTGLKFPNPTGADFFMATLINLLTGDMEVIKVTTRSTDDFSVIVRAQEDIGGVPAAAKAFNDGDVISLRPTAGFFSAMATTNQIQDGTTNYAAAGGTANAQTLSLTPTLTTYAAGHSFRFKPVANNTGAATINIDSVGAKDIKKERGGALVDLDADDLDANIIAIIDYESSADDFILLNPCTEFARLGLAQTFTKTQTWARGTDVDDGDIAAGILTLPGDGNSYNLDGTADLDGIATLGVGTVVRLVHTSARTITHDAADLICIGGADILTEVGDVSLWEEYATADWRMVGYERASGAPLAMPLDFDTPQATTSGTEFDFTVPSGVEEFEVHLTGVSLSGSDDLILQIGDAVGGLKTTGYLASAATMDGAITTQTSTSGFIITQSSGAATAHSGEITIKIVNVSSFIYHARGHTFLEGSHNSLSQGRVTLSGPVDRVRLTRTGTNTFDAGEVNVSYRFREAA